MRRIAALVVGVSLLVLPACGDKTDETARAAGITPVDAVGFASVNLDPSIEQKRNLLSIARRFPDAADKVRGEFEDARDELIAEMLADSGLDYERDVKPWLGNEVALAVLPPVQGGEPTVAVLVETSDQAKARAALEKAAAAGDFEGSYQVLEDFVVIAEEDDEAAEQATLGRIADQAGKDDGGLAESDQFTDVVDGLAGDRLFLAWVHLERSLGLAESVGGPSVEALRRFTDGAPTLAADLHVESSAVVFQAVAAATGEGNGERPELTRVLPATTLAALTLFNVGKGVTDAIAAVTGAAAGGDFLAGLEEQTGVDVEADLLSWMGGEVVLVVGAVPDGGSWPDAALVVAPSDAERAQAGVEKIRQALADQGLELEPRQIGGVTAFVVPEELSPGIQPVMALSPDRFVLASNPAYLEQLVDASAPKLADTDAYVSVLAEGSGDDTSMQFVALIDPIREAIERFVLTDDADRASYEQDVKPNLEPLAAFGIVARQDGGFNRVEVRLTFD